MDRDGYSQAAKVQKNEFKTIYLEKHITALENKLKKLNDDAKNSEKEKEEENYRIFLSGLQYMEIYLIFSNATLSCYLTEERKFELGCRHHATLKTILFNSESREKYFTIIKKMDHALPLPIPITQKNPECRFPASITAEDAAVGYVLHTLADRYPDSLGSPILATPELNKLLTPAQLTNLGIKHPTLALQIINDQNLAEQLPEVQKHTKATSLVSKALGAMTGALIAGVAGTLVSLFYWPVRYLWYVDKSYDNFVMTCFIAPFALPFLFLGWALLRLPCLCYELVRGACFGWDRGIEQVWTLPAVMVEETMERGSHYSRPSKSNSVFIISILSRFGVVEKKFWHWVPATTVIQQAGLLPVDYSENELAGFPNPVAVAMPTFHGGFNFLNKRQTNSVSSVKDQDVEPGFSPFSESRNYPGF